MGRILCWMRSGVCATIGESNMLNSSVTIHIAGIAGNARCVTQSSEQEIHRQRTETVESRALTTLPDDR